MSKREILFRGKRVDNGKWVEGDLSHYVLVGETHICRMEDNLFTTIHKIDQETICRYTGYKDDTGKRIFEGDVVCFEDMESTESGYSEKSCCGKVGYDEREACFYVTDRLSAESWEVLGECHIIGNIFDNPELLN